MEYLQAAACAADLQNSRNVIINSLFSSQCFGSWDHANLVRIEFSSKLPQELRQIVEYRPQTEPQTFEKLTSTLSSKTELLLGFLVKLDGAK